MIIHDKEFGEIIVKKNNFARYIKSFISTSGRLQITVPLHTSTLAIKRYLKTNRTTIRQNLPLKDPATQRARDAKKKLLAKKAKAYLPYRLNYWAKKYGYHYDTLKFSHANTRWGSCTHRTISPARHSKCTSRTNHTAKATNSAHITKTTTISLNIGLMQVPEPLRDYVILHELAHLHHADHSKAFWAEVASHDPLYKRHRAQLKSFSPGV